LIKAAILPKNDFLGAIESILVFVCMYVWRIYDQAGIPFSSLLG